MELTVIACAQPPPPNGESTQLVSLSAEMSMIEDALSAAATLAQLLGTKSLSSDEMAALAPIYIDSVLSLAVTRLTHLRRVLSCEADPRELLTTHNAAPELTASEDFDVRLRPWTAAQRATHLARLLAKAEAEAKREGPTPPSP